MTIVFARQCVIRRKRDKTLKIAGDRPDQCFVAALLSGICIFEGINVVNK